MLATLWRTWFKPSGRRASLADQPGSMATYLVEYRATRLSKLFVYPSLQKLFIWNVPDTYLLLPVRWQDLTGTGSKVVLFKVVTNWTPKPLGRSDNGVKT